MSHVFFLYEFHIPWNMRINCPDRPVDQHISMGFQKNICECIFLIKVLLKKYPFSEIKIVVGLLIIFIVYQLGYDYHMLASLGSSSYVQFIFSALQVNGSRKIVAYLLSVDCHIFFMSTIFIYAQSAYSFGASKLSRYEQSSEG